MSASASTRALARVLMTTDAVGGVWQYSLQLAALLAGEGIQVLLAVMGPAPSSTQRAAAATVPGLHLRVGEYALEWMPDPWDDVDRARQWLAQLEEEFAPDVVHLNGYVHAALPWSAPVLVVAHSCVASWWDGVHGAPPPPEWNRYMAAVASGLRAADCVVAPSRAMRDAIVRFYGRRDDVRVIPNARREGEWAAGAKQPFVFAAGRFWDPAKNLATLDEAAVGLPWPVRVAGDTAGPNHAAVVPSHVETLGAIGGEDMGRLMSAASIYALPARYEPFGLSVLEAALSGCALVLGDIPSLRENWTGVARFVHPGRPDVLRATLQDLIETPAERERLGRAARARAASFSTSRHSSAYLHVYAEMTAHHDRTADTTRSR